MAEFIQFVFILTVGVEGLLDNLNGFFDDTNQPNKRLLSKALLDKVTVP
jgi:hypothetical protein